jgi:leucyl-tRNA synthetase
MYEMFMGPLEETKPWDTNGVKGVRRFLDRIWRFVVAEDGELSEKVVEAVTNEEELLLHKTIKKVTHDTATLGFNTAIASMMEFVNFIYKQDTVARSSLASFVLLLAPYAPHMAEELWEKLGNTESISTADWPTYDEAKLVSDTITIVVQVNGKVRDQLVLPADVSKEQAEAAALASEKIQSWLDGNEPKKVIYVPGKLVSIVV